MFLKYFKEVLNVYNINLLKVEIKQISIIKWERIFVE